MVTRQRRHQAHRAFRLRHRPEGRPHRHRPGRGRRPEPGCASPAASDDLIVATKKGMAIRFHENGRARPGPHRPGRAGHQAARKATGSWACPSCERAAWCSPSPRRALAGSPTRRELPGADAGRQGPHRTTTPSKYGDVAAIKVVDMEDDIILISAGRGHHPHRRKQRAGVRPAQQGRAGDEAGREGSKVVTLARVPTRGG